MAGTMDSSIYMHQPVRQPVSRYTPPIRALTPGPTGLPTELGVYHNLVPLGAPPGQGSRVWGHPAPVYKATSTVDGNVYALRRIEGGLSVLFKLKKRLQIGQRTSIWCDRYLATDETSEYRRTSRGVYDESVQR